MSRNIISDVRSLSGWSAGRASRGLNLDLSENRIFEIGAPNSPAIDLTNWAYVNFAGNAIEDLNGVVVSPGVTLDLRDNDFESPDSFFGLPDPIKVRVQGTFLQNCPFEHGEQRTCI